MSQMWKVVDWKDDSDNTLVHRFEMPHPKWEIMTGSKLTVRESQLAVFVNKGQIADIFTPGQYTLSTGNLPILSGLRSLLYQGIMVVMFVGDQHGIYRLEIVQTNHLLTEIRSAVYQDSHTIHFYQS